MDKSIDWNKEGETDPVVREELAVWFHQHFKGVEAIVWNPNLKRFKKIMSIATITIIVLASLGLVGHFSFKGGQSPKEDSDVIAANRLIEALSSAQSSDKDGVTKELKDGVTEELKNLGLIENQDGKMKISADMKGTVLTSMARKRVFPVKDISELFSSKEGDNINLKDPQIVGNLIGCKKQIIFFAGGNNIPYTPFITPDQVDALNGEVKKHRETENKTYIDVFRTANTILKNSCNQDLAKNNPLKFLKDCYREFGKENKDIEFWNKSGSLLESCGKVKL